jgi:ribosomal protein S18 acetylase RimI-like enzyme
MNQYDVIKGYSPGILGRVTELHGLYYKKHWDFGLYFESQVARNMAKFLDRYDESQDGLWVARMEEAVVGAIVIDGIEGSTKGGHLRWYIVSDSARGTGIGSELLTIAINHCREREYPSVFLHTFKGLLAAEHLYRKMGFVIVDECSSNQWGPVVKEQKYRLDLANYV